MLDLTNPWVAQDQPISGMPNNPYPVPEPTREPAGKGKITRTIGPEGQSKTDLSYKGQSGINHQFETALNEDTSYFNILNELETKQEMREKERQTAINRLQNFQQDVAQNTATALEASPLLAVDLKPAAALVDSWYGTKLASASGEPMNVPERVKLIQNLQEKADEQRAKNYEESTAIDQLKLQVKLKREDEKLKNEALMQSLGAKMFGMDVGLMSAQLKAATKGKDRKPLPTGVLDRFGSMETAIADVRDLMNYAKTHKVDFNILSSIKAKIPGPFFEKEKALASQILLRLTTIGRNIEGGVLRKEDEIKFGRILADIKETPELAMFKLRELEHLLSQYYIIRANTYIGTGDYKTDYLGRVVEGLQKTPGLGAKGKVTPSGTTTPAKPEPKQAPPAEDLIKMRNRLNKASK